MPPPITAPGPVIQVVGRRRPRGPAAGLHLHGRRSHHLGHPRSPRQFNRPFRHAAAGRSAARRSPGPAISPSTTPSRPRPRHPGPVDRARRLIDQSARVMARHRSRYRRDRSASAMPPHGRQGGGDAGSTRGQLQFSAADQRRDRSGGAGRDRATAAPGVDERLQPVPPGAAAWPRGRCNTSRARPRLDPRAASSRSTYRWWRARCPTAPSGCTPTWRHAVQRLPADVLRRQPPGVLSSSLGIVGQTTANSPFKWAFEQLMIDGVLANVSVHRAGGD